MVEDLAGIEEECVFFADDESLIDASRMTVRDQLITHNYDYFDFIHTLLPTELPLKEFYAEYHDLYTKGIALSKQLSLLQKYPLKEIPGLLVKGRRFYNRLKTTYLDYDRQYSSVSQSKT